MAAHKNNSKNKKRFALMGVAGYVAPKHLKAIFDLNHDLVAAMDPNDSVGVLDKYFPKCHFFTSFERFERFLEKEKREKRPIDFLTICTPNYLHDAHCRFGLRMGMDVICEKPIVLNPWNLEAIIEAEKVSKYRVANILQFRYHSAVVKLRKKIHATNEYYKVSLTYITPRGNWYYSSWKGDMSRSGGLTTNIGVHLFDLLIWIFGPTNEYKTEINTNNNSKGTLFLQKGQVTWFLSTDYNDLPEGQASVRQITINDEVLNLDSAIEDLHTICYEQIIKGHLISCIELRPLIRLLSNLREKPTHSRLL